MPNKLLILSVVGAILLPTMAAAQQTAPQKDVGAPSSGQQDPNSSTTDSTAADQESGSNSGAGEGTAGQDAGASSGDTGTGSAASGAASGSGAGAAGGN